MPKSRSQAGADPSLSPQSAATTKSSSTTAQPGNSDDAIIVRSSAKNCMEKIHERNTRQDEEELALKRKLIPRLAKRAYHLEDENSWFQDWVQYQKNTHPVFGLCMYHRLHPIRLPQRVVILVGSIAFGFAMTNCVYLGFLGHEEMGNGVKQLYAGAGKLAEAQQKYTNVELQQSVVFLLTVGSFLHSAFDNCIWYMMACFCCRPGGPCGGLCRGDGGGRFHFVCQTFGIYAAVLVVMIAVTAATTVMVVRLTEDQERVRVSSTMAEQFATEEFAAEQLDENSVTSVNGFSFLVGYALELFFALFVFYFITSTVFFSGILGCGRLPILGGRPYEIWSAESSDNDDDVSVEDGKEESRGIQSYEV